MSDLRIARVSATPLRLDVPAAPYNTDDAGSRVHWHGRRQRTTPARPTPVLEYVLARIETEDGRVGVGEATVDIGFFGETLEQARAAIEDYLGPQLVGRDPFDREHLMWLVDFRGNSTAKSAIDMALHDLVGRVAGISVSELIGGRQRERIQVAIEIAGGSPEGMAERCVELMGLGVRAFKPKIGGDPGRDAERLAAIRGAVGPEVALRADANQGFSPKQAIELCRLADRAGVGLELLEQPVPAWDLEGMALVRRSVDTLIEADESCYSPHDALALVRAQACDVLNVKLGKAGGLLAARKIAAVAEAAGLGCVLGTAFAVGPELAAKLHLASSIPIVVDAVEFTELSLHGTVLAPPYDALFALPLEDGCLPVPTAPGLGVELDEAAVERHAYAG
jgi:L-alanine-DL-glutamate epimerase-like enolase superfamily enzyme